MGNTELTLNHLKMFFDANEGFNPENVPTTVDELFEGLFSEEMVQQESDTRTENLEPPIDFRFDEIHPGEVENQLLISPPSGQDYSYQHITSTTQVVIPTAHVGPFRPPSPESDSGSCSGSDFPTGQISSFLQKMVDMLKKPSGGNIARWSQDGMGIIIDSRNTDSLQRFFKTTKMSSFVRQLNMYGFSKAKTPEEAGDLIYFENPNFTRDAPNNIYKIKRRVSRDKGKNKTGKGTGIKLETDARLSELQDSINATNKRMETMMSMMFHFSNLTARQPLPPIENFNLTRKRRSIPDPSVETMPKVTRSDCYQLNLSVN